MFLNTISQGTTLNFINFIENIDSVLPKIIDKLAA